MSGRRTTYIYIYIYFFFLGGGGDLKADLNLENHLHMGLAVLQPKTLKPEACNDKGRASSALAPSQKADDRADLGGYTDNAV